MTKVLCFLITFFFAFWFLGLINALLTEDRHKLIFLDPYLNSWYSALDWCFKGYCYFNSYRVSYITWIGTEYYISLYKLTCFVTKFEGFFQKWLYVDLKSWFTLVLFGLIDLISCLPTVLRLSPLYLWRSLFIIFLPAYITYILIVFIFRTYCELDLKTPIMKPLPSLNRFVLLISEKLSQFYNNNTISTQGRISFWVVILENISDSFFF
jgi:hypothetical protein